MLQKPINPAKIPSFLSSHNPNKITKQQACHKTLASFQNVGIITVSRRSILWVVRTCDDILAIYWGLWLESNFDETVSRLGPLRLRFTMTFWWWNGFVLLTFHRSSLVFFKCRIQRYFIQDICLNWTAFIGWVTM